METLDYSTLSDGAFGVISALSRKLRARCTETASRRTSTLCGFRGPVGPPDAPQRGPQGLVDMVSPRTHNFVRAKLHPFITVRGQPPPQTSVLHHPCPAKTEP